MSDISPPKLKEGQVQDIRILGVQESESATQFETSQSISGVSDLVVKKSRWVGPKVRGDHPIGDGKGSIRTCQHTRNVRQNDPVPWIQIIQVSRQHSV